MSALGADRFRALHARAVMLKAPSPKPYLRAPIRLDSFSLELFFDIEVDPLRGVCYLHGFVERINGDNATERFVSFFADEATAKAERDAFAAALDYLASRSHAGIYYYSKYERTIYRKLQQKYPEVCTRADIEQLFDPGRAIDLYGDVVLKATGWATRDHSIKTLAKYLGFTWRDTHPSGAASVEWFAVSNLLSAALKLPRLCIVISNLSGAYEGATKEITAMVAKATRDLQNETGRQAKGITPVELGSDEIYSILRTRLLNEQPNPKTVGAVATAFSDAISDAVKSKSVAKSATQIADEIAASYPFHPSFKHILALFKENERFRQTRGLMTMAALMVKSALARSTNDVFLVGCQHIDLSNADVRDAVTNVYDLSGAIAHDIAGTGAERAHAQTIDDQMDNDSASQVARLVLMASLSEANDAVKGLTKAEVVQNLVAPHHSPIEFDEAFEKLRTECWYLHRKENDAWYFSKNENLKKKIEKYAVTAPQPKIDSEMERRLTMVFEAKRRNA